MKRSIWLSFDLGVRGDYEGIYTWLDERNAKECGDSLAFLEYNYGGDFVKSLTKDLESAVDITKKTRIYVIFHEGKRMKGSFVFGNRRAAPWSGYAPTEVDFELDEA